MFGKIKGILVVILFIISNQFAVADTNIASQCNASDEYLAELQWYGALRNADKDFSCLADMHSLGQKLSSFQIVDIRSDTYSREKISKDSCIMPVSELKHKSFLLRKPLLLIGDGFSRANAANDCAILRKAGFSAIKILVGGIDVWKLTKAMPNQRSEPMRVVSAQQFIFEYFNHRVAVIATSPVIAETLTDMGITKFYLVENKSEEIGDVVLTRSGNGFDPVVIVSEYGSYNLGTLSKFHNLYQLAGGVVALRQQLGKKCVDQ